MGLRGVRRRAADLRGHRHLLCLRGGQPGDLQGLPDGRPQNARRAGGAVPHRQLYVSRHRPGHPRRGLPFWDHIQHLRPHLLSSGGHQRGGLPPSVL